MPKKRKRKKIVVPPPAFGGEEEPLLKDTTGVEALDVSKASMRAGRYLSVVMMIVGLLLSAFCVYGIIASVHFLFSSPFFIGGLGFLGAVNIFCGLILLAKE